MKISEGCLKLFLILLLILKETTSKLNLSEVKLKISTNSQEIKNQPRVIAETNKNIIDTAITITESKKNLKSQLKSVIL
jgi:hypothetical protein